ncbi:Uncharacterized protein dnm_072150 [Desulfonema magnum]|uniref:Uncharacterized protein n=1 Tax=Desulfonema magnum TaxID=45655 RepID=A0A975BQ15_9BACT|nr:Uncharacterized protein dnm_014780 [Desulfonema magnum]QTA86827.1 Uncharacterized protein dnm_028510 [Desulfonema magnum]QTA86829.1 Uncharacterized protein dnm_028530 [Desulfonema magnum]QTA86831.1 Uncharacterized protein dnm_028550 [Desulfonema magnum]QTA87947.1 Uncharacterized protein dnm_039860 [Desulfonema magnum]
MSALLRDYEYKTFFSGPASFFKKCGNILKSRSETTGQVFFYSEYPYSAIILFR